MGKTPTPQRKKPLLANKELRNALLESSKPGQIIQVGTLGNLKVVRLPNGKKVFRRMKGLQ